MSVSDKLKHAAHDAKGKAKEAAGKVTGNTDMQAEGQADQGEAHAAHAADKAKDSAKNLGSGVKGKAKEVGGALTDDESLEAKGKAEELAARAKQKLNK